MMSDSPSYFVSPEFEIVEVNPAATTIFGIQSRDLPIKIADLLERLKRENDEENSSRRWGNLDDLEASFRRNFVDRAIPPPVDIEPVYLTHSMFGDLEFRKVGLAIPERGGRAAGWSVAFQLVHIENRGAFDMAMEAALNAVAQVS